MPPEPDLEMYVALERLHYALCRSVQDPIIIANPQTAFEDQTVLAAMPFDATEVYFYVEDEGEGIVRERIERAGQDIKDAVQRHDVFLGNVNLIAWFAKEGDREGVAKSIRDLCQELQMYKDFVKGHQKGLGPQHYFLEYPHYRGGNMVQFPEGIVSLDSFNPAKSYDGFEEGVEDLQRKLEAFRAEGFLPGATLFETNPQETLAEKIELTKMLLWEHFKFPA